MSDSNLCIQPNPSTLPTTIKRTLCSNTESETSFHTDLLLQLYSDRIFVVISQYGGKVGSLLHCCMENSIIDNSKTYEVETLLGSKREDGILELYARQLLETMVSSPSEPFMNYLGDHTNSRRFLLLGISLRDSSQVSFQRILNEVLSMYNEAMLLLQ